MRIREKLTGVWGNTLLVLGGLPTPFFAASAQFCAAASKEGGAAR